MRFISASGHRSLRFYTYMPAMFGSFFLSLLPAWFSLELSYLAQLCTGTTHRGKNIIGVNIFKL